MTILSNNSMFPVNPNKLFEPTDKERVNAAFKELRKLGYVARQNFKCCSSCAWYELGQKYDESKKIVFYNQQANARAWYRPRSFRRGRGDLTDTLQAPIFLQWQGNAPEIVEVLTRHDLNVEWKGSDMDGIGIMPSAEISKAN